MNIDLRNLFEHGDIKNCFGFKKIIKKLKIEYLEILEIFLRMKKKKIVIEQ